MWHGGARLAGVRVRCLALLAVLNLMSAPVVAQTLQLTLAAVDHPAFSAAQIGLRYDALAAGRAEIELGRLTLAGREFRQMRLRCGSFSWSAQAVTCRQGELQPGQATPLPIEFAYHPSQKRLELEIRDGDLATLAQLIPELQSWQAAGRVDAHLTLTTRRIGARLTLRKGAFSDAPGERAGDKIDASLNLMADLGRAGWAWSTTLDWPRGELYIAPIYRTGAMHLTAAGRLEGGLLVLEQGQLALAGVGQLDGRLRWQAGVQGQPGKLLEATVSSGPLDLATLVPQFVQPVLDARAGPRLMARGRLQIGAMLDAQGLRRLDVELADGAIESGANSLQGVAAHIPWHRDEASQAILSVTGGRFGALPLGAFSLPLAMQGTRFSLPRAGIPVLDGQLLLEDFQAVRKDDAWQWGGAVALEPVAMPLLTEALGWPRMAGVLSASIPRIRYDNATLSLDGQVVVSLFDGYLMAENLKLIEPFGGSVTPRLQGDLTARHIDLGILTETFSFGGITGYIDADVRGLEMAGMQPLAFDARIHSTAGDYTRRISQRAVQNISSLGGAGAGAAIQRSFLRFFDTFGYERIAWSCRLANSVCQMDGLDAPTDGRGYTLVKGGGIPALNVIGYNQKVDWAELVERLQAAIAANGKVEIR
jgi:hypothetical protein